MKRLALIVALIAVPCSAFSLFTFSRAPQLVWYTAGAAAGSGAAVAETTDFFPIFLPYGALGLDGGGTGFGLDSFEFDTITCAWEAAGTASGSTDVMTVQLIQRADAGVVCSCNLPGLCTDVSGEHTCGCGAIKYLGVAESGTTPGEQIGKGYAIQWSSATNCAGNANPKGVRCAIPFRQ